MLFHLIEAVCNDQLVEFWNKARQKCQKNENHNFIFTPKSNYGSKNPKHKNEICYGYNIKREAEQFELRNYKILNLEWLIKSYKVYNSKNKTFFTRSEFFDLLAGSSSLRQNIIQNKSFTEIKTSWKKEIENFKIIRNKYLIYK